MTGPVIFWLGSGAVTVGLLLIVFGRPFTLQKISVIGLEFQFKTPIKHPGYRILKRPGIVLLIVGVALSGYGGYKQLLPDTWPSRFKDLRKAEINLSEVDDVMYVSINDQRVARAEYGETPGWIDVTKHLKKGTNKIETTIENGRYGGCGGTLELKLNGFRNPEFKMTWSKPENQMPWVVCFKQVKTLILE